jgi:sec-independent protein translocase protein TatB
MFDVDAGKLLLIGVVALVVIGPKELPGVLRTLGKTMAKMRQMAGEFRSQFDEAMREAELTDAKNSIQGAADMAKAGFNPLGTIRNEIKNAVDGVKTETHAAAAMVGTPAAVSTPASAASVSETKIDIPAPLPVPPVQMGAPAEVPQARPKKTVAPKPTPAKVTPSRVTASKASSLKTSSAKTSSAKVSLAKVSTAKSAKASIADKGSV